MIDLELLGVGGDGESLVFTDSEGERYCVPMTDELRAATRRDRPRLESVLEPAKQGLRPRDIQALLRAGVAAEDIAATHGMDIQSIRRFESPIEAEKQYALQRARSTTIGTAPGGPTMGDLVVDRLAARGVSPQSLSWSAKREASGPWQITVTFIQGAAEHAAHWTLTSSGSVEAMDQEAQWLTETITQAPTSSIFSQFSPRPVDTDEEEVRRREALVDQLNATRGKPQDIEYDLDDEELSDEELSEFTGNSHTDEQPQQSIAARIYSIAQARTRDSSTPASPTAPAPLPSEFSSHHSANSQTDTNKDDSPLEENGQGDLEDTSSTDLGEALPGLETLEASSPAAKKNTGRRRSVPSWDEIVFGSRPN